jgi:thiol:disulfide interchange protein DsbD
VQRIEVARLSRADLICNHPDPVRASMRIMRRLCLALLAVVGAACWTAAADADEPKVSLEIVPDEPAVARGGALGIDVFATIARGWHINAHKPNQPFLKPTALAISGPEGVTVEPVNYPPPDRRTFAFAGDAELLVYEGKLGLATAIRVPATFAAPRVRLETTLHYQACDDTTCLRPTSVTKSIEIAVRDAAPAAGAAGDGGSDTVVAPGGGAALLGTWLAERGLLFTLAAVALLGLGLNLTPCVYPLISVTVAYFGGQARGRGQIAGLAALYVLGIALSFSVLGLAAALSGGLFGAALQKPAVVLFIAGVMVVLALGSFGLYQLQPPAALMQRVGGAASGAAGALFMGLTMGIVAAPCVGPIVVGLLIFVGSRQDAWLGFVLFFVLALGMGAPYLVLAMAAGSIRHLPRSGEWLMWTERLFGCVLLSLAAYYVAPLLPLSIKPWLLPVVVALSGLYLGFIEPAGRGVRYFPALKAGVGAAMVAVAVWLALPAETMHAIAWEPYARAGAAANGRRPVLIDFAAEWCIPCREMDHTTYVHPDVVREADRFHMVRADLTDENDTTTELMKKYEVKGVPTVILFSPQGDETRRMVGYVGPDELLAAMRAVR